MKKWKVMKREAGSLSREWGTRTGRRLNAWLQQKIALVPSLRLKLFLLGFVVAYVGWSAGQTVYAVTHPLRVPMEKIQLPLPEWTKAIGRGYVPTAAELDSLEKLIGDSFLRKGK
jgi:hypothetical protein